MRLCVTVTLTRYPCSRNDAAWSRALFASFSAVPARSFTSLVVCVRLCSSIAVLRSLSLRYASAFCFATSTRRYTGGVVCAATQVTTRLVLCASWFSSSNVIRELVPSARASLISVEPSGSEECLPEDLPMLLSPPAPPLFCCCDLFL